MKKAKILSLGLCLALAFTACGKKGTGSNTDVTLGKYKGVEVSVLPVEVTDEDMQTEIDYLLKSNPEFIEITDRKDVQDGDVVNIDYVGSIDGEKFDGGSATDSLLTIGSNSFIDDFEDQLIGHTVGETVDVNVTFPETYSNNPDLAGKDALFVVTINKIGKQENAELTDEFVAAKTEYKTVEEYKTALRESLLEDAQNASDTQKEIDLITAVIDESTFNNLSQEEIDQTVTDMNSYYESMASSAGIDYSLFKLYYFGMDEETFDTEIKKAAELQVKQKYVLEAIVKAEGLTVSDEEYTTSLAEYAKAYNYESPEKFEEAYGKENVSKTILLDKALAVIKDNAVEVEATEATPTAEPTATPAN